MILGWVCAFVQAFCRFRELVDVAGSAGRAVCAPAQLLIAISAKRGRAVNSGPSGPSEASRAAALLTARPRAATRGPRGATPSYAGSLGEWGPGGRTAAAPRCADRQGVWRTIERAAGQHPHERRAPPSQSHSFRCVSPPITLGEPFHFLNPELVIVGGDIGTAGYNVIRAPLLNSLRAFTMHRALSDVTVLQGKLGDHASRRGAAALVLRQSDDQVDPLLGGWCFS